MCAEKSQFANALTNFLATTPIRNADLAEKIADSLNRGLESEQSIDELLMTSSKLVDSKLREVLEQFTGAAAGQGDATAVLERCIKSGLIRSRDEPIYHYLYWYFTDRRNASHHEFPEYGPDDLVAFIVQTQFALEQVESLRGTPRFVEAKFDIRQDPTRGLASIDVSKLWQGSNLIHDARVEAIIRRPDRQIDRIPLVQSGGSWGGMYDYRGLPTGSYNLRIQGEYSAGGFTTSSGAEVYVSGRICGQCGRPIEPFTAVCPHCSKNQSGFIISATGY
jgi:hypothetical protein